MIIISVLRCFISCHLLYSKASLTLLSLKTTSFAISHSFLGEEPGSGLGGSFRHRMSPGF